MLNIHDAYFKKLPEISEAEEDMLDPGGRPGG